MNYEQAWQAIKDDLADREKQYGIERNPGFDPMTMGLFAEIKDLQLRIEEIEEESKQR